MVMRMQSGMLLRKIILNLKRVTPLRFCKALLFGRLGWRNFAAAYYLED